MTLTEFTGTLSGILWNPAVIVLCFGVAAIYSIALKFPQIRFFKDMVGTLKNSGDSESGVTPFQAFAMSLGNRVGVGALAGVATAIGAGGPGALFWMWLYTVLGACSSYAESVLGQMYKEKVNGEYRGGPSYYLKKCPGPLKVLGVLSALSGLFVFGFTGPATQSFNISSSFKNAFGINEWITSIVVAILFALIVFGGMKRIAHWAGLLVPIMSGLFLLVTIVVLAVNIKQIPGMLVLIFSSALNKSSMFGGLMGAAVTWGIKRCIYCSEAGMGSGAYAASAAETSHPAKQGLAQAFSVFATTLVCTCTAFMMLATGCYNVVDASGNMIYEGLPGMPAGIGFVQNAINTVGSGIQFGPRFVAIALFLFALTTVLAQGFFVQNSLSAVFPGKHLKTLALVIGCLQIVAIIFGGVSQTEITWNLADIGNGFMTWFNLIGMLFLVKPVMKVTEDYARQRKAGKDPVFNPEGTDASEIWYELKEDADRKIA